VGALGTDDPSEGFGADGGGHRHEGGVGRVVVEAPDPAVLGEVRVGGMRGEQAVEPLGDDVDVTARGGNEGFPQVSREGDEAAYVAGMQLRPRGIPREDGPQGRDGVGWWRRAAEGVVDGQHVDKIGRHDRSGVLVGVEPHAVTGAGTISDYEFVRLLSRHFS